MSAFSAHNENLQIAWDASSLKSVQFCPRHYQYANLEGWQNDSVDLEFGRLLASGLEHYQKERIIGKSKEQALLSVSRWALEATWNEDGTQWGGHYSDMWKCNGDSKEVTGKAYRNPKGNVAKCPFAFEAFWSEDEAPDSCGMCGGTIRKERRYVPNNSKKNRHGLLRALVWYGLDQPENLEDGYHPYVFPNGTPAVELSGRLPLPKTNTYGEQYMLTYNLDYIGQFGRELFITDNKSTSKTLNEEYFSTYSPDTQFDTYDLIGSVAYPALGIRGTMVEAVQLTTAGVDIGKHPYYKVESQREEHFHDLLVWLDQAEGYAMRGYWPMNKRSCWLCPFKRVCSLPPEQRQGYLKATFSKRERWDPTAQR